MTNITAIEMAASAIRSNGGLAVIDKNTRPVKDLFEEIGGYDIQVELLPLAAVDEDNNVVIGPANIKYKYVRQTTPEIQNLGIVKSENDIISHASFMDVLDQHMRDDDDQPIGADVFVIQPRGTAFVQYPVKTIDVYGDEITQHLVIYSNVIRSKGSGVVLWSVPIRCLNQIPVMRMSMNRGGLNYSTGGKGFTSKGRIESYIQQSKRFVNKYSDEMKELYTGMAEFNLDDGETDSLLWRIYRDPELPRPKVNETPFEIDKKMTQWLSSRKEASENREAVKEILAGQTDGARLGTSATRPLSLYTLLQAVSDHESHRKVNHPERLPDEFIGTGKRSRPIYATFNLALETLRIDKTRRDAMKKGVRPYSKSAIRV
jgi:hypothetical protein